MKHVLVNTPEKPGDRAGRLVIIGQSFAIRRSGKRRTYAVCRCDCGAVTAVQLNGWRRGNHTSCGCFSREATAQRNRDRGVSKLPWDSRLCRLWMGMLRRCYMPTNKCWENYGQRGIEVCREWRTDFQAFERWAQANGYADHLTIDRIDNDRGYSPDNCRWVGQDVQQNNRTNNIRLTAWGETKTVSQWSRDDRCRINLSLIYERNQRGWPAEQAISTPADVKVA